MFDDSTGRYYYFMYNEDKSKKCDIIFEEVLCNEYFPWAKMPEGENSQGFPSFVIFA